MRTTLTIEPTLSLQQPRSFFEVLEQLHKDKHTGPVIVHLAQGQANAVEIPTSKLIRLEKR